MNFNEQISLIEMKANKLTERMWFVGEQGFYFDKPTIVSLCMIKYFFISLF